ncbi:hypothetical protein HGRIS_004475 [Hohenbuehelia grisea]|uniref:Uncharacterized protein n=1 Tax=Hohenbuehelia grisea TaxID=104357 RepID=A0ABR3JCM0_9AGAR
MKLPVTLASFLPLFSPCDPELISWILLFPCQLSTLALLSRSYFMPAPAWVHSCIQVEQAFLPTSSRIISIVSNTSITSVLLLCTASFDVSDLRFSLLLPPSYPSTVYIRRVPAPVKSRLSIETVNSSSMDAVARTAKSF